jgi:hypothetical protein
MPTATRVRRPRLALEVRRPTLRFHEQLEQVEHLFFAVERVIGCHHPAEDPLELFAAFKKRRAVLSGGVRPGRVGYGFGDGVPGAGARSACTAVCSISST